MSVSVPVLYILNVSISIAALIMFSLVVFGSWKTVKNKGIFFETVMTLMTIALIHTISFCLNWVVNRDGNNDKGYDNLLFPSKGLCNAQGFLLLYFTICEGFSVANLLEICHESLTLNEKNIDVNFLKKKNIFKTIILYGLPLIISIVGLAFGFVGPATRYCYIKKDFDNKVRDFCFVLVLFIPLIISLFLTFYYFLRICILACKKKETEDDEDTSEDCNQKETPKDLLYRIIFFPIIEVLALFATFLNRFLFQLFNIDDDYVIGIGILIRPIPGLIFPIYFGIYSGAFKYLFFRFCCGHKENQDNQEITEEDYDRITSVSLNTLKKG